MTSPNAHSCAGCLALSNGAHADLRLHELAATMGQRHRRSLAKRQFLFHDGDMPDGVYSVSSGSFKLFKSGPDGDEHIIGLALPGTLLGVRALIADEPYSVSAVAREESAVCFFEAARFRQYLARSPEAARSVFSMLGRQLREAREELLERSAAPAPARLAHCLLHLESLYTPFGGRIKVSGQELASMIGVTPETISRQLKELDEEGLIIHNGKEIRLKNKAQLTEIAEENRKESKSTLVYQ